MHTAHATGGRPAVLPSETMGFPRSIAPLATLVVALLAPLPAHASGTTPLRVCTDNNDWLPYLYLDDETGQPVGVHRDLLVRAVAPLGYHVEMTALPWRRCQEAAAAGRFDAVASASYSEERAQRFYYPPGAEDPGPNPYGMGLVSYVLVSYVDDDFEFDGRWETIPSPARVPRGYSMAQELRAAGVDVDEGPGDRENFLKLVRDRRGVVVSTRPSAEAYATTGPTAGLLRVHESPALRTKAYFLVFPAGGPIGADVRRAIWDAIAEVRQDEAYLARLGEAHGSVGAGAH